MHSPIGRALYAGVNLMAARAHRRFERLTSDAELSNVQLLQAIIRINGKSRYVADVNPTGTQKSDALSFLEGMPCSEYGDYEPYIEQVAAGHSYALTGDHVPWLLGSGGTTGTPKRLPTTRRGRQASSFFRLVQRHVLNQRIPGASSAKRGSCLIGFCAASAANYHGLPVLPASSAGMKSIRRLIPWLWNAPIVAHETANHSAALYLQALFALRNSETSHIAAVYCPHVTHWIDLIFERGEELIKDIAAGSLRVDIGLSSKERSAINALLCPDPRRALTVESALAAGRIAVLPRLWPEMKYIATVTSGSFSLALPRLRRYAGTDLTICSPFYGSTESMIGVKMDTSDSPDYVLALGAAFFEFLPAELPDGSADRLLQVNELSIGSDYEVVITTYTGLWRYRLHDVIRVVGFYGSAPVVRFLYRKGTILNLVGEKTTEMQSAAALTSVFRSQGAQRTECIDYSLAAEDSGHQLRYCLYVELEGDKTSRRRVGARLAREWEGALGSANPLYETLGRRSGRLAASRVCVVERGTFQRLADITQRIHPEAAGSQAKTPRLVRFPFQIEHLERSIVSSCSATGHY